MVNQRASLTPKQAAFVREYLIDLNGTQAAIRAGYSANAAEVEASRLLRNAKVAAAVAEAQAARAERCQVDADWVLKRWTAIVEGDPNELIQYRRGPCKDCGVEDIEGDPNPDCETCHGEGRGRVHVADTRKLGAGAKALYAGVKLGKDGLQVLMHNQLDALGQIARHLGMFVERRELTGKDGEALKIVLDRGDASVL